MKSNSCFGKISGKPLTEYQTKNEAKKAVEYLKSRNVRDLIPYKCDRCGYWHLSPKNRQTPSKKCPFCTDTQGKAKDSYLSQKQATLRANILLRENGKNLSVYRCPHGNGWHLTKRKS